MSELDLKVRYYQDSTPDSVPCREENFIRREIDMKFPISKTAFVVVDVWDIHHIDSYVERMGKVLEENLLPALEACRKLGMTVIHSPCPEIAEKHFADKIAKLKVSESQPGKPVSWPPEEFRHRAEHKESEYYCYRHPREQEPGVMKKYSRLWDLSPDIDVKDDEFVVANGAQMDVICQEHGILHLLYVGFLTNWCILRRDYGIRTKADQGYNVVLLRDATTGSEYPDTLEKLFTTEIAIREVEQQFGFSASNADFLTACQKQ